MKALLILCGKHWPEPGEAVRGQATLSHAPMSHDLIIFCWCAAAWFAVAFVAIPLWHYFNPPEASK